MKAPRITNHGSEVLLLGLIAGGVIFLLWRAIALGKLDGLDVAAFLLVLQRVIEAVQARWTNRSIDRMSDSLANSPPARPPAGVAPEGEAVP